MGRWVYGLAMKLRLIASWLIAFVVASLSPMLARAAAPERDRASILAMAGDFHVRFDMRETTAFVADYTPIPDKVQAGFESVRVVEDRGDFISLQHLLVVEAEGQAIVVKHWRQDWTYQPQEVLIYQTSGRWALRPVAASEREGAWSQTVWQTDDGPRYGGIGRWSYAGDVASWRGDQTRRPLALRDSSRKPAYSWYEGWNRHALTPTGWVHEQDNAKLGLRDGRPTTYVHEVVTNAYTRTDGFPVKAAEDYWAKTRDYWAGVRGHWSTAIARRHGVTVREDAGAGSATGPDLAALAEDVAAGTKTLAAALRAAGDAIAAQDAP